MTSPAAAERAALVTLLAERGPDAPTLLPAWTTHDLAAHLVVRERRPHAVPGLVLPPLHPVTALLERRMRRTPYDDLLRRLAEGPPPWSAGAVAGEITDLHEMFVHHEDVRRVVDPEPRTADADLEAGLWDRVRVLGPALSARARGLALRACTGDGRSTRLRLGGAEVAVVGPPGERLLWLFGRKEHARVELRGSHDAVARARRATLGW